MKKFDITKHSLVPKHAKLSDKEKKQLLEKYNITLNELPKILANDPAIKDLGLKNGDVVKIERISKTAGEYEYYRGVVNA
ncbi:DNA-directed RNA polymerase subunit H [Candidatus Woesearchaeota archaeon]|nr:DNA-directed RNA polymerase subunit H [Candidatus Woesearchaeota archaeon]